MMSATKLSHRAFAGRHLLLRSSGRTVRASSVLAHPGAASGISTVPSEPSVAWSHELSYASPESDFTSQQVRASNGEPSPSAEWSHTLSFASPESDFASQPLPASGVHDDNNTPHNHHDFPLWSGILSFASPESDFVAQGLVSGATATTGTLPRTLREVLALEDSLGQAAAELGQHKNPPAIVVTTATAPHRIVHVNRAWEELCGYGKDEVVKDNKTLSILQGPKSNADLARSTVSKLVRTHQAVDMYQVNYAKSGREFLNHVTMGPLTLNEDSPDVEFLVAVLERVEPEQVPLRMVNY